MDVIQVRSLGRHTHTEETHLDQPVVIIIITTTTDNRALTVQFTKM